MILWDLIMCIVSTVLYSTVQDHICVGVIEMWFGGSGVAWADVMEFGSVAWEGEGWNVLWCDATATSTQAVRDCGVHLAQVVRSNTATDRHSSDYAYCLLALRYVGIYSLFTR